MVCNAVQSIHKDKKFICQNDNNASNNLLAIHMDYEKKLTSTLGQIKRTQI